MTDRTRFAAYLRVSSAEQARSGLGLEAQRAGIEAAVAASGDEVVAWFTDAGVSATTTFEKRPGASSMLGALARGEADGIVVYKLDRAARSTIHGAQLLAWCQDNGIAFRACDLNVDTTTPGGRMVAQIFLAVAEYELHLIANRQRDAHASRRARGVRTGAAADPELHARITAAREAGATWAAIAADLNAEGVPTVRGGTEWRPSSVQAAGGYRRPGKTEGGFAPAKLPKLPVPKLRNRGARTAVKRAVTEAA